MDDELKVVGVGEEVDRDDLPRQEWIAGEGVGGRSGQGDKVLEGGVGVAADVDQVADTGGSKEGS